MKLNYMLGFVFAACLHFGFIVVAEDMPNDNELADCFRKNAVRSIGSKCFAKKEATFGRGRTVKKHALIKYIIEKCGVELPFLSAAKYRDVLELFLSRSSVGQLQVISGTAQIGDIVVDKDHMMMIIDLGRFPILLRNGQKILKSKDRKTWNAAKRMAGRTDWRYFIPFADETRLITPGDLPGQCSKSWNIRHSTAGGQRPYMKLIRATRNEVREVQRYKINTNTKFFRYISQGVAIAFSVARRTSQTTDPGQLTLLSYDYVGLNEGDGFVTGDSSFTSANGGLYFGAISVAGQSRVSTSAILFKDESEIIGLETSSDNHYDPDIYSRNFMLSLQSGAEVKVEFAGNIISESGTNLGMCDLEAAMYPLDAFSLAATESQNEAGPILFQQVLYNSGSYSSEAKQFTSERNGLYFFAMSVGFNAGDTVSIVLKRNGLDTQYLERSSTYHNGMGTISTGCLLILDAGDRISVSLNSGTAYSDDIFKHTSFLGFRYSPRHGDPQAWSVLATQDWVSPGGDSSPLHFDAVDIDTGNLWNSDSKQIEISVPGIYYVHLTVRGMAQKRISASVKISPSRSYSHYQLPRVYRPSDTFNGEDTASSGTLIRLQAGDMLWVEYNFYPNNYAYRGSTLPLTSFAGMMIYKD